MDAAGLGTFLADGRVLLFDVVKHGQLLFAGGQGSVRTAVIREVEFAGLRCAVVVLQMQRKESSWAEGRHLP